MTTLEGTKAMSAKLKVVFFNHSNDKLFLLENVVTYDNSSKAR